MQDIVAAAEEKEGDMGMDMRRSAGNNVKVAGMAWLMARWGL
jgi:hypothetical protein